MDTHYRYWPETRKSRKGKFISSIFVVAILGFLALLFFSGCSLPTESQWVVRCYDIWNRETAMEFSSYSSAKEWYNHMTFEESPPHVCYISSK